MDGNKQMVKNEKTFSDFSSPIPSSTLPSWRTMPPRGRTTSPWWTHFQSVEGCTYLKDSFYSESLGDFRLAKCLHCDKLVRRGKPGCTARETTRGWHRTWGPSTVDLLSRWCSSLNFVVQLPTPYPQPLKTTLGFPLNSTNAWGLQLWIKILCNLQVLEKIRRGDGAVRLCEESSSASCLITSAGTLLGIYRRLIGWLYIGTRSAGPNISQYIGSTW